MKSKHFLRDLVICAFLGAAAAGLTFVPVAILAFVATILLLYTAGSLNGPAGAAAATAGYGAVLYPVLGVSAVPEIAFAAVLSFGAWLVVKYARRAFYALCGACAVVLLAQWTVTLVGAAMFGTQVIDALFVAEEAALTAMQDSYLALGYTRAETAALVAEFAASYSEMAPGVLLVYSMVCGAVGYGITTYTAKSFLKFRAPAFEQWYMPRGHLPAAFLLLVAGFLLEYTGSPLGVPAMLAVELFVVVVYSIQGAAVIWFMTSRSRFAAPVKYIIFTIATLFLMGFGLLMLAVMDNISYLRKRAQRK